MGGEMCWGSWKEESNEGCRQQQLSSWNIPVEVGARGFSVPLVRGMFSALGISGQRRKASVRRITQAAKGTSCWVWTRRDTSSRKRTTTTQWPNHHCGPPSKECSYLADETFDDGWTWLKMDWWSRNIGCIYTQYIRVIFSFSKWFRIWVRIWFFSKTTLKVKWM